MKALIFSLFIFISSLADATDFRIFYGVGPLFINPGTVRFGVNEWDFGLLGPGMVGAAKNYYLGGLPYMSFGIVSVSEGLGFFGSAGLVGDLFWNLRWRTELQSAVSFNGGATGNGIIGLEVKF